MCNNDLSGKLIENVTTPKLQRSHSQTIVEDKANNEGTSLQEEEKTGKGEGTWNTVFLRQ